jgi:hypothetical protein
MTSDPYRVPFPRIWCDCGPSYVDPHCRTKYRRICRRRTKRRARREGRAELRALAH